MKKYWFLAIGIFSLFVALAFTNAAQAWDYGITILDQKAIHQLSDQALTQAYITAVIEVEAAKVLHIKAGFTPKDYAQFKELIRYRVNLLLELQGRKLDIPKIES